MCSRWRVHSSTYKGNLDQGDVVQLYSFNVDIERRDELIKAGMVSPVTAGFSLDFP